MGMKKSGRWIALLLVLALAVSCAGCAAPREESTPQQTLVATAEFSFRDGVPVMNIEGIGEVDHPAWISIYALAYMGQESYYHVDVDPSDEYAENCIDWLKENAKPNEEGLLGWSYTFDSTYNDVSIEAPWYSAYGQACGIDALVHWYEKTGDEEALEIARESAEMIFTPIAEGGTLFTSGDLVWFEEIPSADEEPSHILNGHMRACIALRLLYNATGDATYQQWYDKGMTSLLEWLPLYDTGYWLRYDLNPKKEGLLFRLNDPEGGTLDELAIDEIRLTDPLTGESVTIDVGAQGDMDAASGSYLAGLDWQAESTLDGRTVRRLVAAETESDYGVTDAKPNTYIYLDLPGEWTDDLRTEWFELTIVYKDEQEGRMVLEQRSIAPDEEYVAMRDGELLLTGSGEWREWTIPLRPSDLGWPVGELYGEKHVQYLDVLAEDSPDLAQWADVARGYLNAARMKMNAAEQIEETRIVEAQEMVLPEQTPTLPFYSLDDGGVARQHVAGEDTVLVNGLYDSSHPTPGGDPVYSPYIVSLQALLGPGIINGITLNPYDFIGLDPYWESYTWITEGNAESIVKREPAYQWLRENAESVGDALVWTFGYKNVYNDLVQEPDWQSAFSQRYVIDAFLAINDDEMVRKAAYAYGYSTKNGGLASASKEGFLWFEEVPNDSHILNAHIASLVALYNVSQTLEDDRVEELYLEGVESLRENLYRYDTGYWTKYDMNPQKNMLFEIDWQGEGDSPLIDAIYMYDPVLGEATEVDVGEASDTAGVNYVSGLRWQVSQTVDGETVRAVAAPQANDAEEQRAAYFRMSLPTHELEDCFDTPEQLIVIRYKDTATGEMQISRQSINEGWVVEMEPLNDAVIRCTGDGEWKTAVVTLRPQDQGWYMGPDYQAYHIEQLALIAEQTGDWYFAQTCKRWECYLEKNPA
ncbi:D-glucuronyl C5-epimerase family protein [Candidatus Allofournierella merdipullorum]|uniref:D-glucuronyl C5-epimerase family protein n=1 Tax=Candidatus Allofournierella merdipullorum TaxID=2838595 RepID=UPI00374E4FEB